MNTNTRLSTPIQLYCGESDTLDRMVSYLTYAGVDVEKVYDDDDDIYTLLVSDEEKQRANKLLQIYLDEEKKRISEEQRKAEENESAPYSHIYEKCEDRYESHRSAALTFFLVGTALLLLLIFTEVGVMHSLPFTWQASPLSFFVIAGVGVAFEVVAISSARRACQLKDQIADEKALTAELTNWFITTYDKRQIDTCIAAVEGDIEEEEILYLKRLEWISCYLTRENEHLDESYVAKLSEDLYTMIYES